MKLLFFFLALSTFSFSQNLSSKVIQNNQLPCTAEMSVKELTSDNLYFKCAETENSKSFTIKNFKIKFVGNPAMYVVGNTLNDASKEIAAHLKSGDFVLIFDIDSTTDEKGESLDYKTVSVKIKE